MSYTNTNTITITEEYYTNSTSYAGNLDNSVFVVNSTISSITNTNTVLGGGGSAYQYGGDNDSSNQALEQHLLATNAINGNDGQHGLIINTNATVKDVINSGVICGGGGGGAAGASSTRAINGRVINGGNGGAGGGGGSGGYVYTSGSNNGGIGDEAGGFTNTGTDTNGNAGGGGGFGANGGGSSAGLGAYGLGGGGQGGLNNYYNPPNIHGFDATEFLGGRGGWISGGGGAGGGAGATGADDYEFICGSGGGGSGGGAGGTYTADKITLGGVFPILISFNVGFNGGDGGHGIMNNGTITNLYNSQNISDGFGPLYIAGNAPTNYNITINSLASYGQLWNTGVTTGVTGQVNFGIDTISVEASDIPIGIYTNVLYGITPSDSTLSGTYTYIDSTDNIYPADDSETVTVNWKLVLNSDGAYDLYIGVPTTPLIQTVTEETITPGHITVTWLAADGNGNPVTNYIVNYSSDGGTTYTQYNTGSNATSAVVQGLVYNTTYYFTVTAVNSVGTTTSSSVSLATPNIPCFPTAPTNVTATRTLVSGRVQVSWVEPVPINNGPDSITSKITHYSVNYSTSLDGDYTSIEVSDNYTTVIITDLTNGTLYYFTVTAYNSLGSTTSTSFASATPNVLPGIPTNVTATATGSTGQVSVSWSAPLDGSAITNYIVEYSTSLSGPYTQSNTGSGISTTFLVNGLINGTLYYFKVTGENSLGSATSTSYDTATPIAPPGPPTNVTAMSTGISGQVSVSWSAPANNGSEITDYIVKYSTSQDSGYIPNDTNSPFTSAFIGNLTNGTLYYFKVVAVNEAGNSTLSTSFGTATPATVPDPPTNVNVTKSGHSAVVTWDAPIDDGGSPITEYTVNTSPNISDVTVNSTTTTATVNNLLNGTTYTFSVKATNVVGDSASSSSISVLCFLQGSKILCLIDDKEEYVPIENITRDTLVKTSLNGYKKVVHIGSSKIINTSDNNRTKDRLYLLSKNKYPELNEDLIITGSHSILVDSLTEYQVNTTKELLGRLFVTSQKYRLMAFLDNKAEIYKPEGTHTIWHLALENEHYKSNYGIYANGLLVESLSIRMFEKKGYLTA
jgi:hypothetical protein